MVQACQSRSAMITHRRIPAYDAMAKSTEKPIIIIRGVSIECGAVASTTVMTGGMTSMAVMNRPTELKSA